MSAIPDDLSQPTTVCAFEVELLVRQGPSAGERHVLQRFPVIVGRGNDADVRLSAENEPMLSRHHLRVAVEGGHVVVTDLSTNGTWVEDRQLKPKIPYVLSGGEAVKLTPRIVIGLRLLGSAAVPTFEEFTPAELASMAAEAPPQPVPAERPQATLTMEALGPIHVRAGQAEVDLWSSRKALVLLACLADGPSGRVMLVERLVDMLWSDAVADARAALQAAVSRLRRAFRTVDSNLPDPVELHRGGYRLSPTYRVRCDAREFELLCDEATRMHAADQGEAAAALLEQALALYRGPFLGGFSYDWVEMRRRTLEERYLDACDTLGEVRAAQGKHSEAMRLFENALQTESCRERSALGLLRGMAATGKRDEALRRYYDFARRLEKEMGVGPGPDLLILRESLQTASS